MRKLKLVFALFGIIVLGRIIAQEAPNLYVYQGSDVYHVSDANGNTLYTLNYFYEYVGTDPNNPSAGYGVITIVAEGQTYYQYDTNQNIYNMVQRSESWWWQFLPH